MIESKHSSSEQRLQGHIVCTCVSVHVHARVVCMCVHVWCVCMCACIHVLTVVAEVKPQFVCVHVFTLCVHVSDVREKHTHTANLQTEVNYFVLYKLSINRYTGK